MTADDRRPTVTLGYAEFAPAAAGHPAGGPDQPSTIVFLPGAGVTRRMWDRQIADLPEYHRIAIDSPGSGRSFALPWESLDATAALVAELIERLAIGGRAHIVGLSMGADVGLRLLATRPELVRSAVLTGMVAIPVNRTIRWMQWAFAPLAGTALFHRLSAGALNLRGGARDEYLAESPPMRTDDYRRIVEEIFSGVSLRGLESVDVPTLVLAGAKEPRVARRSTTVIASVMPGAVAAVAPGVGHMWNIDDPELFGRTVRLWVRDRVVASGVMVG
ncbi:alpha/beta fold hydrolase [Plantibacter sp. Mn2098]|uniref:alpha/beta fold hydrolase n=1 Tax=Plantibacter sp. Mn2098 TaxID=3395266 RepID=UPI003BC9C079